ncbi:MAG TPA: hypothetical protein VN641_18810 [Urbifossiella sp.]|nr:hypothetical protein [Urbifossiella sp.]
MRSGMFAVAAALAFAGSASAQNAGSSAQPAPGPTAITVPAAGCSTCGASSSNGPRAHGCIRGFVMQSTGGYWLSNCPNGQRCNNGAGSFRADLGFAFGPSKSFFDPCGPRILPDCGAGGGCGKCRTPILGRGPAGPWSPCVYDVYQNH